MRILLELTRDEAVWLANQLNMDREIIMDDADQVTPEEVESWTEDVRHITSILGALDKFFKVNPMTGKKELK